MGKKYEFLKEGIKQYHPKIMTILAKLIETHALDDMFIRNKMIAYLYQAGANAEIPIA